MLIPLPVEGRRFEDGNMGLRLGQDLTDPPTSDQLASWRRIRVRGRARYIGLGTLFVTVFSATCWLASRVLLVFVFDRDFFSLDGVTFAISMGPVFGFWYFWLQWKSNERRYLSASPEGAESTSR